jgi:prepilin-type N-terminal cleavage/methylation domain-containing protein
MSHSSKHAGFTLVELMVTVSIMLIILGTLVFHQSTYSDGAALNNLADTIGLTLRQAQIYGISVKEFNTGSNNFSVAYGADFDILPSAGNNAYIFFADLSPQNGIYDSGWSCPIGGTSECITKSSITGGNTISSLCEIPLTGPNNCSIGRIDITFLRPEITANMAFFDSAGNPLSLSGVKGAQIKLLSPGGSTRSVTIYTTGQISVE